MSDESYRQWKRRGLVLLGWFMLYMAIGQGIIAGISLRACPNDRLTIEDTFLASLLWPSVLGATPIIGIFTIGVPLPIHCTASSASG